MGSFFTRDGQLEDNNGIYADIAMGQAGTAMMGERVPGGTRVSKLCGAKSVFGTLVGARLSSSRHYDNHSSRQRASCSSLL